MNYKAIGMNKLLIICGPTATGKTSLAAKLAKKYNGEIISADSRQVYRGMDIGTGKDRPQGVTVWGYDLVDPNEDFSVAQYQKFARNKISQIWQRGKLPILVGGTGFYIKAVVDGIGSMHIPPDPVLREKLQHKSAFELFDILVQKDPEKAKRMNQSDKNNPRRLVRAIETAVFGQKVNYGEEIEFDSLFIGLGCESVELKKRIKKRVKERIKKGMEEEVVSLLRKGVNWQSQALNTLGYRLWRSFFKGDISLDELEKLWVREERQYAKRQITWFKKETRIKWFNITHRNYEKEVEKLVEKWYS